ncbi:WD40/YVTN/BNR-like repeat-containing protein [Acidovorax sp. M2(2025)]|uniref:WD40/YVTN/BNR-like repeat-containing protein n=1 Tax=Acidovorax sp. M2(2025) TaxID=3411355 RepID=UPI003BF47DA1
MKTLAFLAGAMTVLLPVVAIAAPNISSTDKSAWSDTSGWVNFAPTGAGAAVFDDHLEGFAWAENVGWIKLGSHSGGGYHRYANSTATDWGVNLNGGALSGYAWSDTAGWVRFDPTGGGVTLNPSNGVLDGWAWAENLGWIHFKGSSPAYSVVFTPPKELTAVLLSATNPQQLRAAVAGSGIHLSSDGGATWSAAATQPTDRRLKAAVVHPTIPSTLFAATHGSGVFKSTDGGANWSACANTGLNLSAYALVVDGSAMLYAATRGGVFASADCATWSARNTGLPHTAGVYSPAVLAVDPATPGTVYAGVNGAGVYRSSNGGGSWSAASTQPASTALRALQIKPGNASILFAASQGAGAFKSTDGGATWATCAGQPANPTLLSLAMDATGRLYAGSEAGVFVSTDDCTSWTAQNTGLPN